MHRMGRRHRTEQHYKLIPNPIRRQSLRMLDALDLAVYVIVGASFVIAAIMALAFSVLNLANNLGLPSVSFNFGNTVLNFISDLLLVLIIMEVLGTVRSYLEHGDTSVKPFIFIGIISATRGVLSIGARLSIAGTNISVDEFAHSMIELAVNGAIIIALGATLRIMGDRAEASNADDANALNTSDAKNASADGNAERAPAAATIAASSQQGIERQSDTLRRDQS
jgi:uncharacterized membrane protein (DUF373 family)